MTLAAAPVALAVAALTASAGAAPRERAAAEGVSAALYYTHVAATNRFEGFRIEIRRRGELLADEAVPPYPRSGFPPQPARFWLHRRSVAVRHLDGDGEPEVLLDLDWGGAHCCAWSRVYRFDGRRYAVRQHLWSNASYALRDLDRDGRPEFVSADDRFAYAFTDYAESADPVQIWDYGQGAFGDVTRRFLPQARRDTARWWRLYLSTRDRPDRSVRGLLAAWAADEELLGRHAAVTSALEKARDRGDLAHGTITDGRGPAAYVRALFAFLRRTGYIR